LGKIKFKSSLQTYINVWNGKHPTPYDFFNIIENSSGKNLSWFWQKCFLEYNVSDLEIKDVTLNNGILKLKVLNKGGFPLPVYLTIEIDSDKTILVTDTPEVWENNNIKEYLIDLGNMKPVAITLGNPYIPDIDSTNNKYQFNSY